MTTDIQVLEPHAEWRASDVSDPELYTEHLSEAELAELETALRHAEAQSTNLLEITAEDFPLPTLSSRLKEIERELIDGRGFVLIRGLPRDKYNNDEMCMLYWGIGMHLGQPWPQNKYGHMLGDVTDQGKAMDDPTARGNELGGIPLEFHSDGSDLVGLLCLQKAKEGGTSAVCNALAIHNDLVRETPELAAELYNAQPYDFRGEQGEGQKSFYSVPAFSQMQGRLFIRYIRAYIKASQRHDDAPRITPLAEAAMQKIDAMTQDGSYSVFMDLEPGDMQFINNYHVLHGRKSYVDDRETGQIRHLKRLWLATEVLQDRPPHFRSNTGSHWGKKKVISRLDAD